jgi:hypothetical protein
MARTDVSIPVPGAELGAWLYLPQGAGPHPAVVMAHGFSAVKELYLDRYAERFCEAGLAVAVFDHRGFGASTGLPRQEADPVLQGRDYRHVITWLSAQPGIDPERIGIWGSSYSGGHVLQVAAADRRVKCVVSQVPTISGYEQTRRRTPPERLPRVYKMFAEERARLARGEPPRMRRVIPEAQGEGGVFDGPEALAFFGASERIAPSWRNEVTVATLEYSVEYEPAAQIEYISPTPLLMLVAQQDTVTPTDLALRAYQRALEPKQLVFLPGGHFDAYVEQFELSSSAARDWFVQHLRPGA